MIAKTSKNHDFPSKMTSFFNTNPQPASSLPGRYWQWAQIPRLQVHSGIFLPCRPNLVIELTPWGLKLLNPVSRGLGQISIFEPPWGWEKWWRRVLCTMILEWIWDDFRNFQKSWFSIKNDIIFDRLTDHFNSESSQNSPRTRYSKSLDSCWDMRPPELRYEVFELTHEVQSC